MQYFNEITLTVSVLSLAISFLTLHISAKHRRTEAHEKKGSFILGAQKLRALLNILDGLTNTVPSQISIEKHGHDKSVFDEAFSYYSANEDKIINVLQTAPGNIQQIKIQIKKLDENFMGKCQQPEIYTAEEEALINLSTLYFYISIISWPINDSDRMLHGSIQGADFAAYYLNLYSAFREYRAIQSNEPMLALLDKVGLKDEFIKRTSI